MGIFKDYVDYCNGMYKQANIKTLNYAEIVDRENPNKRYRYPTKIRVRIPHSRPDEGYNYHASGQGMKDAELLYRRSIDGMNKAKQDYKDSEYNKKVFYTKNPYMNLVKAKVDYSKAERDNARRQLATMGLGASSALASGGLFAKDRLAKKPLNTKTIRKNLKPLFVGSLLGGASQLYNKYKTLKDVKNIRNNYSRDTKEWTDVASKHLLFNKD